MVKWRWGLGLALVCFGLGLGAAEPVGFPEAVGAFQRLLRQQGGTPERVEAQFAALEASDPARRPLYAAYRAATQTLRGRDAWWPWEKLRQTEQGLNGLEKAVAQLQPEHAALSLRQVPLPLETRLLAVETFLAVPEFFHRRERGVQWLQQGLADPQLSQTPPAFQARWHFHAAAVARQQGDAARERAELLRVQQLAPDETLANTARQRLKELG